MHKDRIQQLERLLKEGHNNQHIAGEIGTSRFQVLKLIRKHGLTSISEARPYKTQVKITHCELCGNQIKNNQKHNRSKCAGCVTKLRRYRTRLRAIEMLGGKCADCGWNKHACGFDFHHVDAATKEFQISSIANKSWSVIEKELSKCMLLCATCHRVRHAESYEDKKFMEAVAEYQFQPLRKI